RRCRGIPCAFRAKRGRNAAPTDCRMASRFRRNCWCNSTSSHWIWQSSHCQHVSRRAAATSKSLLPEKSLVSFPLVARSRGLRMEDSLARRQRVVGAPDGFRPATIVALFAVLMAAASIPILTHPLPPLEDYANHLARTYVIDAIDGDRDLARFYAVHWQIVPNLMIDLIVPVLLRVMNVYVAGQVYTIAAFSLIVS